MVDDLRAPSGQAAAPVLLTECRGRSPLPPIVSLLIPSSSLSRRGLSVQNLRDSQVFLAVAPGLVNECRGRLTCEVSRRASSLADDK